MSEHTQTAAGQPPSGPPVRQMGAARFEPGCGAQRPSPAGSPRPEGDVTLRRAPGCVSADWHDRTCDRPTVWHNPSDKLARCTAGHLIDLTGEQS